MAHAPSDLPVHDVLPEVVDALEREGGAVLVAPTGAGKTTQVPQALLDRGVVDDGRILVLEPRRVAARATARRIARERGAELGGEVGYQVRFDRRIGSETRIAVVTEGILTRRLQDDPMLKGIDAVVLDEFHERSVRADLSIAFLKELSRVREDLSLVVMSATIDAGPIADYLGVPSVESEGRTYPVDVEYLDQPSDDPMPELVARAVRDAIEAPDDDGGDILAFLPGAGSIERTVDRLEELSVTDGLDVRPLYGALPPEAQDRAVEPGDRRKIVVSTNIAETSLTIEGVTTVVDSGRVKRVVSDTGSGLERLEEGHVSLASAEQRAGRAGRTEPGRAYRLWTRAFEHRLDERETPELLRVDITGPVLEVIAWSGDDPRGFDWFEPPSERAIERAEELLAALGAIDREAHRVTELGRRILDLPVHPRIGRALVEAADRGCLRRVASMVAVLSERDFVLSVDRGAPEWGCDLQFRADVLDEVARGRTDGAASRGMEVHVGRARRVKQVRDQLAGLLDGGDGRAQNRDREARKALATGYPDRICVGRGGDRHYAMVEGEPLALAYESVAGGPEFLVASDIAGETRGRGTGGVRSRQLIREATALERDWVEELFPDRFVESVEVGFDRERERVMAVRRRRFGQVTLDESVASVDDAADDGEVARELVDAALDDLDRAFDLSVRQRQFLLRIESLRRWRPQLELPAVPVAAGPDPDEADDFRELLVRIAWGERSFDDLRRLDLIGEIRRNLTHEQVQGIEELAPPEFEAPSGYTHTLEYRPGKAPALEVRIQEMFGTTDHPAVAGGEVPVRLKLLAPNFRPAQITDDLSGFWEDTYHEVRKEYRADYPAHPWPEEPADAQPVAM